MAFDRKTGQLWAGDVGQNLYEEIDIINKGGNYGWNLREGFHPFGAKGVGAAARPDRADLGVLTTTSASRSPAAASIAASQLPELDGAYLYADYVSSRIWALRYDETRVASSPTARSRPRPAAPLVRRRRQRRSLRPAGQS